MLLISFSLDLFFKLGMYWPKDEEGDDFSLLASPGHLGLLSKNGLSAICSYIQVLGNWKVGSMGQALRVSILSIGPEVIKSWSRRATCFFSLQATTWFVGSSATRSSANVFSANKFRRAQWVSGRATLSMLFQFTACSPPCLIFPPQQ